MILDELLDQAEPEPMSGCYLWIRSRNSAYRGYGDYGYTRMDGKKWSAHRLSWFLANGFLPEKPIFILHRCDTPACINPRHLKTGTQKENVLDRDRKGRRASPQGGKNALAKLTDESVIEIRRRRLDGALLRVLAKDHGVSISTIHLVVAGKAWTHLCEAERA